MSVKKVKISELPLYPETEPEDRVSIPGADGDNKTYRVTMDRLKGDTGAVFTPSVDAEGNLSWSNDKGLENPSPANIRGPKGDIGNTGLTGKSVYSFMTEYDVPLSTWKSWLDETNEYSGYNVPDTTGVNVGDTVILHGKISDLGNTPCYFVGEVTRIESANRLCVRTPLHLFYGMENGDIYARQRSGNDLIQYSNEFNFASDDCKNIVVNHRRGSGKSDGGIHEYCFCDGGGNLTDIRAKHFVGKASRLGTDNEYSAYVASWHSNNYDIPGILIKLPYKCDTDAMFMFDVLIHSGYEISHYTVSGYLYPSKGSIYRANAVLKSGTGSFGRHVTMGADAQGNAYVFISSPWINHPAVTITDVMTHWKYYDWSEGWEIRESDGSVITTKDFDADLYPPASIMADNILVSHGNEFNFANETCNEVWFNYRRGNGVGSGGIHKYHFADSSGNHNYAKVKAKDFIFEDESHAISSADVGANPDKIMRIVKFPKYSDLGVDSIDYDYFKALCKWVHANYNSSYETVLFGIATPNSIGVCMLNMYDNNPVDSNGNPKYMSGQYISLNGNIYTFSFVQHVYSFKKALNEIPSSINLPGSPTTTTQAVSDNSTKIATTAYVNNFANPKTIKAAGLLCLLTVSSDGTISSRFVGSTSTSVMKTGTGAYTIRTVAGPVAGSVVVTPVGTTPYMTLVSKSGGNVYIRILNPSGGSPVDCDFYFAYYAYGNPLEYGL